MFLLPLTFLSCINFSYAQKKVRPPIKNRSGIEIEYQQRSWNIDSKSIDSGYVVIKDTTSNKVVVVQVQESEPDSSVFTGSYNLELGSAEKYVPSVFIPSVVQLNEANEKEKFLESVKNGKLSRRPFILKKEGNRQVLQAFDTRAQAQKALKDYRKQRAATKRDEILKDNELVEEAQLERADNLALAKKLVELKQEAIERDNERKKQLEVEKQKLEDLRKAYNNLSSSEKEKASKDAASSLAQAFSLFTANNFTEADALFYKALEKDPYNNKTLYSYAVNLFRKEEYNKSIIYFRLTTDEGIDKTEKAYYIGSNHYKLIELHFAEESFNRVKNSANKNLSGSSAFYLGLIQYQKENYNSAKSEFEFVLDNSIDPELDKQAEAYIERIQHDLQFVEARKKPYHANLSLGLVQDSNILLQPNGTAASATATDDGGLRFQLMGSLEYKFRYTKEEEWSLKSTVAYFYSFDSDFTQADPLDIILSAPYKKNSKAFDRSYRWEVDPGLEVLFMDVDQEGSRENILNAGFVNWKNSFVMSDKWISNYNFQLYLNESDIDGATGDDDSSGMKYSFMYNNIYFVDREKGKTLIYDIGVLLNDADGKNYNHTRYDLAINYIQPITFWDLTLSAKLAYYVASYDSDDNREDKNSSFNLTAIKSINDWLSWNASVGYTDNTSNVSTREYDKYTIGTNVTGKWNF